MHRLTHTNPFGVRRRHVELPEGGTLLELLAAAGVQAPAHASLAVYVGDRLVPAAAWAEHRPVAGAPVCVFEVPLGGGDGNKVPRLVATIAVVALAAWAGPAAAGVLGLTGTAAAVGGAVVSAGVGILGVMAVNALLPPPSNKIGASGQERGSSTYQWAGARNEARPYGVVPRVYGTHRLYPPLAALPYLEVNGDDQWLHLLLDCGYGPLEITDLKVGETDLAQFVSDDPELRVAEVEVRSGETGDPPLTLYRNDVSSQSVGSTLPYNTERTFSTAAGADEATAILDFAGLVDFDTTGARTERSVTFEVAHRATGSSDPWVSTGVLPSETTGATGVSLITESAGAGTRVYRTTNALADTVLSFDVAAPTGWADADRLEVSWRPFGETAWRSSAKVNEPALPQTVRVVAVAGKIVEVQLRHLAWTKYGHAATDTQSLPAVTNWAYSVDAGTAGQVTFRDARETALRKAVRIVFPATGQYDVRLKRLTADAGGDTTILDEATWSLLQSVTYGASVADEILESHALIALRVRATDTLQGSLDQINCVATSKLLAWDDVGETWIGPYSSDNPAWVYADILCGSANDRPVDRARLDTTALDAWAQWCVDEEFGCNLVLDWPGTVFDALRTVAAAGRAAFGMNDGLYSVVRDGGNGDSPVQHFSPRNSWGFGAERIYTEAPHGLRMRFPNAAAGYVMDERTVYADGYDESTATRLETLEVVGVTSADQAWRLGRYHLAVAALRPEVYRWSCDIEHLACQRGDLITLAHDVPLFGLAWGRIKSLVEAGGYLTEITLDEVVPMAVGTDYGVRIRTSTGGTVLAEVNNEGEGEWSTLTFTTPEALGPAVGDLVLFGEWGSVSVDLLVRSVEPGPDFTAVITAVDFAPGVLTADSGSIPAYSSNITLPPVLNRQAPAAPTIVNVGTRLLQEADGGYRAALEVLFRVASSAGIPVDFVEVQYRIDGTAGSWLFGARVPATAGVALVPDVETGVTYQVRIRSLSGLGYASVWVTDAGTVGTDTTAPAVPTGLTASFTTRVTWTWTRNTENDFSHYLTTTDGGSTWRRVNTNAVEILAPSVRSYTLQVKAVDRSGNMSAASAGSTATLASPGVPTTGQILIEQALNVFRVSIDAAFTKSAGHLGYKFRYSFDDAIFTEIADRPHPTATVTVPLAQFVFAANETTCTVYVQAAEVDAVGAGSWSSSKSQELRLHLEETDLIVGSSDLDANISSYGFAQPDGTNQGVGWRLGKTAGLEAYGAGHAFGGPTFFTDGELLVSIGSKLASDSVETHYPSKADFESDGQVHLYRWIDPTAWASSTVYAKGDLIKETGGSTYVWECTTAGTSGGSAPTWANERDITDVGELADNTAGWRYLGTADAWPKWSTVADFGISTQGSDLTTAFVRTSGASPAALYGLMVDAAQWGVRAISRSSDGVGVWGYATGTAGGTGVLGWGSFLEVSGTLMGFTPDGGLAVKVTAGEQLYRGEVVCVLQGSGVDGRVFKTPTSGNEQDMPVGVVYQDSGAAGSDVWIVVAGRAYVLPTSGVTATRGYVIVASSTTAGRVDQATTPGAAQHWREVGHWLTDGSGNGVATLALLHFN